MALSRRRQQLHLCTLLICIKFVVIASSPGGGVLPPPPPPPPPPQRFDSNIARDDSSTQAVPSEWSKVEEHSRGDEEETATKVSSQTTEDGITSKNASDNEVSSTTSAEKPAQSRLDDTAIDTKEEPTHDNANRFSEMNAMSWESAGASDVTTDGQQQQQQKQWDQQAYQYPNQQWNQDQNQPNQSWGQGYQQQHLYNQYSNQHQPPPQMLRQQQQQQYPQYYQPPRQQQQPQQQRPPNSQLAIYNRPKPTPPVGASASRLFSLAAKKLQSGLDSVSETFDTNNLASSVTSLTTRIGSNINTISGAITGSQEGLKTGGGARRMGPPPRSIPPMMHGGPRGANGPPPPQRRQQTMPQQRTDAPSRRPAKGNAGEEYAPPMSELYSFNREMTDNVVPSMGADDDTDSDIEDDHDYDHEQQQQQQQPQSESTPLPFSSGVTPKQYPSEPSRPSQFENRRPSVPSSFPQSSSSQTTRRRYDDFDDYDDSTIGSKIKGVLGSVPIPRIPKFSRSSMGYDDGSWSDDESSEGAGGLFRRSKPSPNVAASKTAVRNRQSSINSAHIPRPVSSLLEKRETLLSPSSSAKCKSIGRSQASLDAIQLSFVLLTVREVVPLLLSEIASVDPAQTLQKKIRTATLSTIFSALDGWAPYAVAAAFLVSMSNSAWIQPTLNAVANEAAAESASDAAYSQLYLRLISSLPMQSFSSGALRKATKEQVLYLTSLARLRFFVAIAVTVVILSTVAVLRPAGTAIVSAVVQLWEPSLDTIKNSPIDWGLLWDMVKKAGLDLASNLHTLFQAEFDVIQQQPLRVAVVVSLIATMMAVSHLPTLEKRRKAAAGGAKGLDAEDNDEEDSVRSLWSNIGSSSSSRLGMLSSPLGVEGALQHFTKLRPDQASAAGILCPSRHSQLLTQKRRRSRESSAYLMACHSLLRNAMYFVSSSLLLSIPLIIYFGVFALVQGSEGSKISWKSVSDNGWVSLLNLASLLFFTHMNAGNAVRYSIIATDSRLKRSVSAFFSKLAETASELQRLSADSSAGADFQAMMTASPTKGLVVSDFWAAHSSRKAWAVKGANVQVKNGEVVLVIGDDGAGKSRLLTGIAEYIFTPPKSARTTTYARGNMNIAGVDISKWDRKVLQKRVGVFLNDIRTVPDYASLMSGCTLEEIIEPVSVIGGGIGPKERNSMAIAMKITGLGSKVSSRFPSKLSTVVSASEDKLKPSPTRPPAYPLSPSEWSRVMLTKVLAQLISGNENHLSSSVAVKKSMLGSILLLDDASALMNETDEGKLITALRSTGAAVLLTSNRWASGRFADRIVVISDGQVIESGTHADLMSLGPERSVYARQWNQMM